MTGQRKWGSATVMAWIGCLGAAVLLVRSSAAQDLLSYRGEPVSSEVERMYTRGLTFLARTQADPGGWDGMYGREPAVVGLAVLAMLAHGDDPNTGPYGVAIGRGLSFILQSAKPENGYIGSSMYNHGFATLALAEAYGVVKDPRIGPALKKAVDLILSSQSRNNFGAWRYAPENRDADTTVSGAQMVALVAARNAGIAVPDQAISSGVKFFRQCQTSDGGFGYTGADSPNAPRTAIGTTVLALARQKHSAEFKAALHAVEQFGFDETAYAHYYLYYGAQAVFQGDMELWRKWNVQNVERLAATQNEDGSWNSTHGPVFCTATALLSMALNYRFLPIYER